MAYDSGVTVSDIRTALNLPQEVDAVIDDDTIEQAIESAEVIVATYADDDATAGQKRVATIDIAAYRAFSDAQSAWETRKSALDVEVETEVQGRITDLKESRDNAIDLIQHGDSKEGPGGTGDDGAQTNEASLVTFGDRRQRKYHHRHRY